MRLTRALATGALSLIAIVALWIAALVVFDVSPYVGKGPVDVWNYLFTMPAASENREVLGGNLLQTLTDASVGFVAGLVAAILVAILFALSRGIEHALMPIAMLLRSVPLVALAPIIILIFGREVTVVAVMSGIVVLFPALVNIVYGLRSASPQILDVVSVYGGSRWTALRLVAMPSSLPAFFASVRISVPGAITGALLAEWLATGNGIGYAIVSAIGRAKINEVWASVVAITLASMVLYAVAALVESLLLRRWGSVARD